MEEVLLPVMYDIPSRDDVAKVVVTKETVRDNVLPTIVPRANARSERRDKSVAPGLACVEVIDLPLAIDACQPARFGLHSPADVGR